MIQREPRDIGDVRSSDLAFRPQQAQFLAACVRALLQRWWDLKSHVTAEPHL
jgi:hypothetical protein